VDEAVATFWGEAHTRAGDVAERVDGTRIVCDGTQIWHDAVGDLTITSDKWGPSVSYAQIRTLRDPFAWSEPDRWRQAWPLHASPWYAAQAALEILAALGWDRAWSAHRSGAWLKAPSGDLELVWGHPDAGKWGA
jgi:hypothetical protein